MKSMKKSKFEKWLRKRFEERLSTVKHEIEQKFRITDPESIRKKLKEMGAVKGTCGMEHNELFDMDGNLREKGNALRLRYHGSDEAWVTFKGPRIKGGHYKKRLELQTPVHYESMKQILIMLGYRVVSTYRKQREEYIVDIAQVCVDYLPRLGWFCEIEGRASAIREISKKLGLLPSQREERSYRRLIKENRTA